MAKKKVSIIDFGLLAISTSELPRGTGKGDWLEGEMHLGVEAFTYSESSQRVRGIPTTMIYTWRVRQIWHLTPRIQHTSRMVRDRKLTNWIEVTDTDAFHDPDPDYVLVCERLPDPLTRGR